MKTIHFSRPFRRHLPVGLVLMGVSLAWPLYAAQKPLSQQLEELLQSAQPVVSNAAGSARAEAAEPARVALTAAGHLRCLGAPPGRHFKASAAVPGQPEQTARNFLREHGAVFGVEHSAVQFAHMKSTSTKDRNYVRLRQTFGGVPILSAEATVQVNTQDGVEFVLCRFASDLKALEDGSVPLTPTLAAADAVARVKTLVAARAENRPTVTSQPALALFAPAVMNLQGKLRLVWDIKIATEDFGRLNERVLLDAHTGEIVHRYSLNKTSLNRVIKDGNNTSDKTTVRTEGQGPCAVDQANNAYDYLGDTYNFYLTTHGRDSVNDDGWTLEATVRYCPSGETCPWTNAQWVSHWWIFGGYMEFGDGQAADDVVAHEYTHGVTDFTSELNYENESGAINESFSDCWGEFVDLTNGRGNDAPGVRWLGGEDTIEGWDRSLKDPPSSLSPLGPQPDRLNSPNYYYGTWDNGGVHRNAGVNNKLCYLLTDGDTFNGQAVYGMGITAVAKLYYEVNTRLLTSSADWTDLYYALKQAASNLNWSHDDRVNLLRACLAVEIASRLPTIYVDLNNSCLLPNGSSSCLMNMGGPYLTIAQGAYQALTNDILFIRTGTYPEALTIDKPMFIHSYDGPVTIGP